MFLASKTTTPLRKSTNHAKNGFVAKVVAEARVLFEESTATLFCGDLFTHTGNPPALTTNDIVGPAKAAEAIFGASCLTPTTGSTIRKLADRKPRTLAVMHGSSFNGDAAHALRDLGDVYDAMLRAAEQR